MNATTCDLLFGSNGFLNSSYASKVSREFPIAGDPDISGVGVLTAFLISVYLALALAIVLFALGLVDPKYTSPVDWRFYRIKQTDLPKLKNALVEGIKALSDQQIVTGIAVLLAGFIRINYISVYHWRIMVSLAWMSSNVHLISLTILKEHLKDNRFMLGWRMCGMILLLGVLIAALVSMRSLHFTRGIVSLQFDSVALKVYLFQGGMTCFWNHREWQTLPLDEVIILELTFLGLNYVWRFCQIIFVEPSQILSSVLGHPAGGIVRFLSAKAKTFTPATKKRHKITYTFLLILYINCKALADIATSFAASLGVLIFSVVWGTTQLLHVRRGTAAGTSLSADLSTYEGVDLGENVWTFGQLVAVLLCILPLLAIAESLFKPPPMPQVTAAYTGASTNTAMSVVLTNLVIPPVLQKATATQSRFPDLEDCLYSSVFYRIILATIQLALVVQAIMLTYWSSIDEIFQALHCRTIAHCTDYATDIVMMLAPVLLMPWLMLGVSLLAVAFSRLFR